MKGGENGAVIVPGNSAESLVVKMIEGRVEKEGKKKIMPPGKRTKLDADEIALRRPDPQVGEIVVHFPRLGYDLRTV